MLRRQSFYIEDRRKPVTDWKCLQPVFETRMAVALLDSAASASLNARRSPCTVVAPAN